MQKIIFRMGGLIVSLAINIICFFAGTLCGIVFLSLFVSAGRADEQAGIK